VALTSDQFGRYFDMTEDALHAMNARIMVVDAHPGFPCRVSLTDAAIGETVLLISIAHQEAASPYRASGPVFVRQGAVTAAPAVNEIPLMFRHRLLSLRAYDPANMMVGATVVPGTELERAIRELFAQERVSYLHIHNAAPGCYNCSVVRA